MADTLSPFCYWGQDKEFISLRIELREVSNPKIELTEDSLTLTANGVGVKGQNNYELDIQFYLPIEETAEETRHRITDTGIEFRLKKHGIGEIWPRLTYNNQKPAWLRPDFDKMTYEESDEEDTGNLQAPESEEEWMKKIERELQATKEEAIMDIKKVYLLLYNLFQFVGFGFVFLSITLRYILHGEASKIGTYDAVAGQLMVVQLIAALEFIHPMVGIVKTGVIAPMMQVIGRNLMLFGVIAQEPVIQESQAVWVLFVTWSGIELVRYPFYLLSAIGMESRTVTFLRYTLWIPMYPVGFATELYLLYSSLPYYEESGKFSISLPNSSNFAFHYPTFLKVYSFVACAAFLVMLKHMWSQTKKRLFQGRKLKTK